MARAIDCEIAKKRLQAWIDESEAQGFEEAARNFRDCISLLDAVPTLTPPNEWVSVYDRLPEPGERVLATDCGFVGEFYINKRGKWQRYNVNCSELLMALDILYWMPLPAPPDKDNNVPTKAPNEPLTLEQLREMEGQPVWVKCLKPNKYINPPVRWRILEKSIMGTFGVWDGESCLSERDYGTDWLAYRRPPEGES